MINAGIDLFAVGKILGHANHQNTMRYSHQANDALMAATIRVPVDLHDKLVRLAQGTHRCRSFLAAEAVAAYVERELSIIDGMQQSLADVAAGRTVAHDAAMGEIDTALAKAKA